MRILVRQNPVAARSNGGNKKVIIEQIFFAFQINNFIILYLRSYFSTSAFTVKHFYKISGMTCANCTKTVEGRLSKLQGVDAVKINLEKQIAEIETQKHIPLNDLQNALAGTKYSISDEKETSTAAAQDESATPASIKTYLPIVLIFFYICLVTLLIQFTNGSFNLVEWMRHFMAGFFLVFSFFKLLDIPAFAESYSNYDIIAKRWMGFGYVYPFIEFGLGISFLISSLDVWNNLVTLVVMSISIIGVLQSVLNKRKIKCACLGAVFNLPMSTVTIIEDALMIVMSVVSLYLILQT